MFWRKYKIGKKDLKCQGKDGEISERMAKRKKKRQNLTGKITSWGKNPKEWAMHYLGAKHSRQNSKCKGRALLAGRLVCLEPNQT